ncbi:nitroreductase, partial [Streptomyces anulatus]|nr:nitroreductase [Streptomyces anulatus]
AGGRAAIDLDRVLRLSLAVPSGTPGRLRPVPSAGALHPVRAHLLTGPGCSLPPGRYAYDPRAHRAHPRGPAPDGIPPGALVVLTVTASRTVAHYGHRAWPLLLLDTGHA